MRYIGLLKSEKNSAAQGAPSLELLEKMGRFMDEAAGECVQVAGDGLSLSSNGARVRLADGGVTVSELSPAESEQPLSSYAMFEVKSIAEAIEWTASFLRALGEGECEIRPAFHAADC